MNKCSIIIFTNIINLTDITFFWLSYSNIFNATLSKLFAQDHINAVLPFLPTLRKLLTLQSLLFSI
jgi:hypothetical protein